MWARRALCGLPVEWGHARPIPAVVFCSSAKQDIVAAGRRVQNANTSNQHQRFCPEVLSETTRPTDPASRSHVSMWRPSPLARLLVTSVLAANGAIPMPKSRTTWPMIQYTQEQSPIFG